MRRLLVPLACAALFSVPVLAATGDAPTSARPAEPPIPNARIAAAGASASAVSGLTLSAAIETALGQNPTLRAFGHELDASDGAVRQAGLIPNPSLSLSAEDTRKDTRTTSMTLSQTIELGGKRSARVALAERERDLAALDLETQRAEVRAATIQAFFDVLIAQERVEVARESLEIAGSGASAVSRRVTAGKVSPVEETRARVAESAARIELRQAQADQRAALQALIAVMGAAPDSIARVDGSADAMPAFPEGAALGDRLERAPALRRARMDVQRAEAAFQLERARGVPDVTVGLGAQRAPDMGRTQPLISVSIPIPLFDRNQGAQMQAMRKREAAAALAQAQAQRLRAEVLQAVDQLEARADEVEALRRDVLPGARGAYEAARRGFELGKFGFLDVLDAQRTWLQARGQYVNALSQAHRLAADIDRRLGGPDPQSGALPARTTSDRP
ncbi:MAG: TolC family protein [Mitsuaria chitosanitabida]|uniref:TolC family protein n=1 Tax=Roseateles chitosanitabidus TaxID=65048 RepID=UPI001B1E8CCD|nr:TolC family protein [Roseateles chitosanitabidus]MBO9687584.1 TolC family protein [Roseateles chitosanitabidus]